MLHRMEAGLLGLAVAFTLTGCTTNGIVVAHRMPDPPATPSPGSPSNDSEALQRLLREAEHAVEQLTGPSLDGQGFFASVLRHLTGAAATAA